MIKIVTIDLDGTLFDAQKVVSIENRRAIERARAMGVKVVIATGRPVSGVMPLLEDLGLTDTTDYAIIYNGAKIFNVGTGEVIYSSYITGKDVKELYQESKRLHIHFHAFRSNEELIVADEHNPYTDVEARINHVEDHLFDFNAILDEDTFLKCMMVGSEDEVTRVMNEVNPIYKERYSYVRSSKIFSEFLNKQTHKGHALVALAKYLDVDLKDTMAIGDAGNDLPMILAAGVGVAMGNAFPDIKEQANYVTSTNEESGVAKAFEKFIFQEK